MNAKQRVTASRAEQPDDLAANRGGCDRISLRAALMKRKITPRLGIRGMSVEDEIGNLGEALRGGGVGVLEDDVALFEDVADRSALGVFHAVIIARAQGQLSVIPCSGSGGSVASVGVVERRRVRAIIEC